MNLRLIGSKRLTAIVSTLVTISLCSIPSLGATPGQSQIQDGTSNTLMIGEVNPALAPGQKLRISIGNHAVSCGQNQRTSQWTVSILPYIEQDNLYRSPKKRIPVGEWRFVDVSHEELRVAGEPGTNRVQVRVRIVVEAPPGTDPSEFRATVETIDEITGKTTDRRDVALEGNECLVFFLGGLPN